MRRLLILSFLVLPACNPMKSEATYLCRHNQLDAPLLDTFPADADPGDYFRAEDLEFLRKQQDEMKDHPIVSTIAGAAIPIEISLDHAMAPHTACEVGNPVVDGDHATVEVKRTAPTLGPLGGLTLFAELAGVKTDEERVKKIEAKIQESGKTETKTHTLSFAKGPRGWRADFQLPEKNGGG
jgi:hypothetical protein